MSRSGAGDGFGADGDRPAVLLFDVAIPGMTVIRAEIHFERRVVVQIITLQLLHPSPAHFRQCQRERRLPKHSSLGG